LVAVAVPVAVTRASFLVPLALACALGLIDDTRDLPVAFRLPTEVAIGLVTAWVAAPHTVPYVLLAVVLVILLLNAANLLDGLDGMLSSVAALGAIGFSVALGGSASALALAFVGALAAFLVWNHPPARVYLGDGGSYLVGTALALMFVSAVRDGLPHGCAAALFVGVPVGDTVVAIIRRVRAHRPILQGDRGHVYDQLVDHGWSVALVLLACATMQCVLTGVGIAVANVSEQSAIAITAATVTIVGATALARFTSPRTWVTDA
jgi:UDP-N-acetylmuramyl pentapeptide phosphotransferase/UDP-N-acetylglucosamine-1-phosphate transferase